MDLYDFQISTENVYDVLEAAEIFLLPDLKRQCGSFLEQYLETSNVVELVQTARLFAIPRLEHACVEFIAKVCTNYPISIQNRIISAW